MPLWKAYFWRAFYKRYKYMDLKIWKWNSLSCVQLFVTPWTIQSTFNSPGQNARVSSLSLLQGIFPTQGSNPGLLHCRQILCKLSHKGRPRILEWVAFPFSRGSSLPRNWTRFSCIAGGFFTNWAIREGRGRGCIWGHFGGSSSPTS